MFNNCNKKMFSLAGQTVYKYGLDKTGQINYTFDKHGFREGNDYDQKPDYVFFGASTLAGIGVIEQKRFSRYFDNSWNFGLCGTYIDEESITNYNSFKKLKIDNAKIVFCWKNDNPLELLKLIKKLPKDVYHCVATKLDREKTCLYPKNLDYDVSNTHWGPITHEKFYKLLCYFLK